jgi:hypothetical protein
MYIDKYFVKVIGQKFNDKKDKYDNDVTKVTVGSSDGMNVKKFVPLLEEIYDAHDGCEIEIDVTIKQHQYD